MLLPFPSSTFFALSLLIVYSRYKTANELNGPGIIYASLGDSIAFGTGASPHCGYVYQFYRYLLSKCNNIRLVMLARPGFTSSSLLLQLLYNANARRIVQMASIITISIGGNNLLRCTCRNYSVINPNIIEARVGSFASDWPKILYIIRDVLCSKAYIYVMTLYIPYAFDGPLYNIANLSVQRINSIIKDEKLIEKYTYNVVDVYSHFEENDLNNWTFFTNTKRNPHPNNEGHIQIALLHEKSSGV